MRCAFILFFLATAIYGQVNTEALRRSNINPGWHQQASFGWNLEQGSSNLNTLKASYRADWVGKSANGFALVKVNRSDGNNEKITDAGFMHLRFNQPYIKGIVWESFYQKEYNDFRKLKDRTLWGFGLRYALHKVSVSNLKTGILSYLGVGMMNETEIITGLSQSIKSFRLTTYYSYNIDFLSNLHYVGTAYYQPNINKFNDYQVLWDQSLKFQVLKQVYVNLMSYIKYDAIPPDGVSKYVLSVSNAITFEF